jgi:hypothetical protein
MPRKAVTSLIFAALYAFVAIGPQAVILTVFLNAPFYAFAQILAFVTSNALMLGLLLYYRQKTRHRWINEEAGKWLASRSLGRDTGASRWRRQIRRGMLWAPTLIELVVFLFFPEVLGIASHLFRTVSLGHHRIEIPLTWIIADNSSYIWVVAARGIGRVGPASYWRKDEPISEMTLYSASYGPFDAEPPAHAKVLSKQELPFGNEAMICWDIIPYAYTRPSPIDPGFAEIICSTAQNDFAARFSGWRTDLPMFYEGLQRVTGKE